MIDAITVEGFLSIRSLRDVSLRPLNVLIGANGAGKSCLIDAIRIFRLCAVRPLAVSGYVEAKGGAHQMLHHGPKVTSHINMIVQTGGAAYGFGLAPAAGDRLRPVPVESALPASDLASYADRWRTYHFDDTGAQSPMLRTARIENNRHLRPDGANLAAVLYLLRERYPESYRAVRNTIRSAMPFLEDLVLEPRARNESTIALEWRHVGVRERLYAEALSDGSLRLIALVTALLQPPKLLPDVMLIDEPELGLHPSAISLVAELIKSVSVRSQVIVATQSPLLVDHVEPEDVLVAERKRGGTHVTRLESERLGPWLDDYSLGQLWEMNELGGTPRPETAEEAGYP